MADTNRRCTPPEQCQEVARRLERTSTTGHDANGEVLVVSRIAEFEGPLTIDELTDLLIDRDLPPPAPDLDAWADLHELLYRQILPECDTRGLVQFDQDRGIVELPSPGTYRGRHEASNGRGGSSRGG